jgi:hypothetical protein
VETSAYTKSAKHRIKLTGILKRGYRERAKGWEKARTDDLGRRALVAEAATSAEAAPAAAAATATTEAATAVAAASAETSAASGWPHGVGEREVAAVGRKGFGDKDGEEGVY